MVGMSKNSGKTETLNYLINQLSGQPIRVALTSIGIDGESTDQVTRTEKPEISVPQGMSYVTAEKHYRQRRLTSEIFYVSREWTSLGRLVAAESKISGKVLLSGPASTGSLKRLISSLQSYRIDLTLVDGALSRLSLASPAVTDGMVLATGAAVSTSIPELVRRTRFLYDLIKLPSVEFSLVEKLEPIEQGVWAVDAEGEVHDLELPSLFLMAKAGKDLFRYGYRLYVAGAVTDKMFDLLRAQEKPTELIIQDFTRVFASPRAFNSYLHRGGTVRCVRQSRLLAITVNPQAPNGYRLDSQAMRDALREALGIQVYDVRML